MSPGNLKVVNYHHHVHHKSGSLDRRLIKSHDIFSSQRDYSSDSDLIQQRTNCSEQHGKVFYQPPQTHQQETLENGKYTHHTYLRVKP